MINFDLWWCLTAIKTQLYIIYNTIHLNTTQNSKTCDEGTLKVSYIWQVFPQHMYNWKLEFQFGSQKMQIRHPDIGVIGPWFLKYFTLHIWSQVSSKIINKHCVYNTKSSAVILGRVNTDLVRMTRPIKCEYISLLVAVNYHGKEVIICILSKEIILK